ncbi:hypothetical protein L3Q82_026795 [Scortum barcoo]|uniref:Uncharacterized protein n=1 Tax=Scortum barcoo TaxID=214431 RepID=A0ACB8WJY6_9TELE|nr:hypothetical protein L3Q82_026795 [Scortum barcoo]
MEWLLLHHLRPQTHHALDPLQFAYWEKTGVEDAIIFLLHRSLSHLDRGSGAVRITFLDFSSAFNTIQPLLLRDKLTEMGVRHCGQQHRSTAAGTVGKGTCPTFSTSQSSAMYRSSHGRHTAIMDCIRSGQEDEYRELIQDFTSHGVTPTTCSSTPSRPGRWTDADADTGSCPS